MHVHGSLTTAFSPSLAEAALGRYLSRLSDKQCADYPMKASVGKASDIDALFSLGGALSKGDTHLGVVRGLEYGWLLSRFPNLEPLAIVGMGNKHYSRLLVSAESGVGHIRELSRPAKLCTYRRSAIECGLWQKDLEVKYGSNLFPESQPEKPTVMDALNSVLSGEADCSIVDAYTCIVLQATRRSWMDRFVSIADSELYPASVVIGDRSRVQSLEANLWNRIQNSLMALNSQRAGQELAKYWNFKEFSLPEAGFRAVARDAAKRHPIN